MKSRPILFNPAMVRALLDGSKTQTRRIVKPQPPEWAIEYNGTIGTYSGLAEPRHYWCGKHPEYEDDLLNWPTDDPYSDEPQWDIYASSGMHSPYGSEKNCIKVAAQLWVKEAHYLYGRWSKNGCTKTGQQKWRFIANRGMGAHFEAPTTVQTDKETGDGWWKRNSLFMPRWASRITLEITGVRVERLHDLSAADALAEGIIQLPDGGYSVADTRHYSDSPDESYASLWESLNGAGSWDLNPWVWVIEFKKVKP